MEIKIALNEDREAIFNIWLSCFTEDEAYINFYLDYCFPHTITLLLGDKNIGYVSVLSIIPSFFKEHNRYIKGGYLYGVGTLPSHRGKSYSSQLIKYGVELLKNKKCEYFIVKPATDSLFSLYKKLGFDKEIYKSSTNIRSTEKQPFNKNANSYSEISPLEINEIYDLREKHLANSNFLWPREILLYSLKEILGRNGFLFIDKITRDYCTGYPSDSSSLIEILETTLPAEQIEMVFGEQIQTKYPLNNSWRATSSYEPKENREPILSALIMELTPGIYDYCNKLNLSLPME